MTFERQPASFIRIVGTHNTANEVRALPADALPSWGMVAHYCLGVPAPCLASPGLPPGPSGLPDSGLGKARNGVLRTAMCLATFGTISRVG